MRTLCRVIAAGTLLVASSVAADDIPGTWTLSIDTPRGLQHPTLVVVRQDDDYSGVYNSVRGPIDVPRIEFADGAFSFPLTISVPIGEIEVQYVGRIEGDRMTGAAQSPRGKVPFTGERDEG